MPAEAGALPAEAASLTVFEIGTDLLAFTGWASPETLEDDPEQAARLRRQADEPTRAALSPPDTARRLSLTAGRPTARPQAPGLQRASPQLQ
jgi:hypothetical protein